MSEYIETMLSVEKERADYGWKNVKILEKAYQEERIKRERAEQNAVVLQEVYGALYSVYLALDAGRTSDAMILCGVACGKLEKLLKVAT